MAINLLLTIVLNLLIIPVTFSQTNYKTIPLGSSLSSITTPSSWPSRSGDFAFGFSTVSGNLYIGIWFAKIPGNPLIWTANRDNPAPSVSTVVLTTDGKLRLDDGSGSVLMEIASGSVVGCAAMLDNGNFVLLNSDQTEFVWQSFAHPTDTIVPGQTITDAKTPQLISPFFSSDVKSGRFYLWMIDGDVFIDLIRKPEDHLYVYETNTTKRGKELVYNDTSGLIYLTTYNGSTLYLTPAGAIPTPADSYHHRATLDYDGILRQYIYPKDASSGASWKKVWSTTGNPCDVPSLCGHNGYCVYGSSDESFDCLCPTNFSFIDPNYKFWGCKPDFSVEDCRQKPENNRLVTYENVDWWGNDYDMLRSIDRDNCSATCLADCLCTVATYRDDIRNCWLKKLPLTRGKQQRDPSFTVTAFVKVPMIVTSPETEETDKHKENVPRILLVSAWALLGVSLFLNLCLSVGFGFLLRRRPKEEMRWTETLRSSDLWPAGLKIFSHIELHEATNGFETEIGRGNFAVVYKGQLNSLVGRTSPIAVKKFDLAKYGENAFRAELDVLGRTHHKNVVRLLGLCEEGSHRLLVYEYTERGSLSSCFLDGDRSRLQWSERVKIVQGIAKGVLYLHEECTHQILHCDIKPENILLDGDFSPKLADFGLAKLLRSDETSVRVDYARGTRGYVAPEWVNRVPVTAKADVYSYGVSLLEIICCGKNMVGCGDGGGGDQTLLEWAYAHLRQNQLESLVENDEGARSDFSNFRNMFVVALRCIQTEPDRRPTMKTVTLMLEGMMPVEETPDPFGSVHPWDC